MTKSVTQRNEKNPNETGLLDIFLGTLHVCFSVIMLADKTARATGQGWKKIRATKEQSDQGRIFNTTLSFN